MCSWLEADPDSLFCLQLSWITRQFDRNLSFACDFKVKRQQQIVNDCLDFHQSESAANTVSWPNTERQICVRINRVTVFSAKSFWIKLFGIREVIFVMVDAIDWNIKVQVLLHRELNVIVIKFIILDAKTIDHWSCWPHSKNFTDDLIHVLHSLNLLVVYFLTAETFVQLVNFGLEFSLNVWIGNKLVRHECHDSGDSVKTLIDGERLIDLDWTKY